MEKNLQNLIFFGALFLASLSFGQTGAVGINTENPNGATVLDINSNKKGILIPRLSDEERDANLADNDKATIPPMGVVNTKITPGVLIYNTTVNAFQYWDGELWRQLFVSHSTNGGNDGVVKINSGKATTANPGGKPVLQLAQGGSGYGPREQIVYNIPLVFAPAPTTSWPEITPISPDMTDQIYIDGKFRENNVEGQVHVWRLICTVTTASGSAASVKATLKNPDSGFEINSIQLTPQGSKVGNILTFYFYTIADQASLDPTKGYQFFLESNSNSVAVVESLTRISLFKD